MYLLPELCFLTFDNFDYIRTNEETLSMFSPIFAVFIPIEATPLIFRFLFMAEAWC